VTGGSGLYLKTLMEGLSPLPAADPAARARATVLYEELGGEAFRAQLASRDPHAAARLAAGDRQRLIRAWEVADSTGMTLSEWQTRPAQRGHAYSFRLIGVLPARETLYAQIDRRFESMLNDGALAEAAEFEKLALPPALPANKALGLRELRHHLQGDLTLEEAARIARQATRNYAKRQLTWFRHQLPAPGIRLPGIDGHEVISELSESTMAKIIPFVVRNG
jgi:tRNA dimethylallyltransferase